MTEYDPGLGQCRPASDRQATQAGRRSAHILHGQLQHARLAGELLLHRSPLTPTILDEVSQRLRTGATLGATTTNNLAPFRTSPDSGPGKGRTYEPS